MWYAHVIYLFGDLSALSLMRHKRDKINLGNGINRYSQWCWDLGLLCHREARADRQAESDHWSTSRQANQLTVHRSPPIRPSHDVGSDQAGNRSTSTTRQTERLVRQTTVQSVYINRSIMRDRHRKAQQRAIARQRAILHSAGVVSATPSAKPKRVVATAEQLAFRDYIQQGYSAAEARAMIAADKLQA